MKLEEMRHELNRVNEVITAADCGRMNAGIPVERYAELLSDSIRWREMMTEREHSDLVVGQTYFIRNLLIGSWVAMLYDGGNKDTVDFCKDTMQFCGPIPMPEVTQ